MQKKGFSVILYEHDWLIGWFTFLHRPNFPDSLMIQESNNHTYEYIQKQLAEEKHFRDLQSLYRQNTSSHSYMPNPYSGTVCPDSWNYIPKI